MLHSKQPSALVLCIFEPSPLPDRNKVLEVKDNVILNMLYPQHLAHGMYVNDF